MPIKTPHTKKAKQAAVHTVMKEFKNHELHSGSKDGPKVSSRPQAIAIAMHESNQSKPSGAKQPRHPRNPGDYNDSAHNRSYGAVERNDKSSTEGVGGVSEHVEIGPDIHRAREAHSFDRPSVKGSHGFGHGMHQRSGALRLSGNKSAHRIGAK